MPRRRIQSMTNMAKHHNGDIIVLPTVLSRVASGEMLGLGPRARYTEWVGQFISAELTLGGLPLQNPVTLGRQGYDNAVTLSFPWNEEKVSALEAHGVFVMAFGGMHGNDVEVVLGPGHLGLMYDVVPIVAPVLHQSAGAILQFANVLAYYMNN